MFNTISSSEITYKSTKYYTITKPAICVAKNVYGPFKKLSVHFFIQFILHNVTKST